MIGPVFRLFSLLLQTHFKRAPLKLREHFFHSVFIKYCELFTLLRIRVAHLIRRLLQWRPGLQRPRSLQHAAVLR